MLVILADYSQLLIPPISYEHRASEFELENFFDKVQKVKSHPIFLPYTAL